ncbi:MAG: phosphoribosyl-AMP cyclohydrolase [Sphingomonadales bacterium]
MSDQLKPKFDINGLITAVAVDDVTGDILMLAHMNEEALAATLETGRVTYYSRSRQSLWVKGETSGHIQELVGMRVDCDQDAVIVRVKQTGAACHLGRRSCFFRAVEPDGNLVDIAEA